MSDVAFRLTGTAYRIERLLAVGGMAEVYLVRETLLGGVERRVVIKRLLPQFRDDDELVTLFFDEVRVSALVQHPNVAGVHTALRHHDDCLIVLEYVPGPSLRHLLDRAAATPARVLPPAAAASIALVLAETMDHVHHLTDADERPLGVVHRDLNPSNVLVSRTGAIKLIDFGIARGEHRVHETATGMLKGTAGYMAPEQLEAQGTTDARTDVFALGVILYELFVGQHPFATKDLLELHTLIRHGRYPRPSTVRSEVPRLIEELIVRSLAPDPTTRPQTMREVADDLLALLTARGYVPTASRLASLVESLLQVAVDGATAPSEMGAPAIPGAPPPPPTDDPRTLVKRPR